MTSAQDFSFPGLHAFPPMFTLQEHEATRKKQLAFWADLVKSYCRKERIFRLDADNYLDQAPALFRNDSIDRFATRQLIHAILQQCVDNDIAEWAGKEAKKMRSHVLLLWKSVPDWAEALVAWAHTAGFTGTVLTGYEVRCGETMVEEEFYRMDEELFCRVIAYLNSKNRLVMVNPSNVADELGFKIVQ